MSTLKQASADFQTRSQWAIFVLLLLFALSSAFSIFLAQVGYFGALIIWVAGLVRDRSFGQQRIRLDFFFLAYAGAELISTILAHNVEQSLLYMQRRMLLIPIVYIMANTLLSKAAIKSILAAVILSALAVSLWSFRDLVLHLPEYLRFERRLMQFQIYMTAGGIMMIACLLVLPFILHKETPKKLRWGGFVILIPLGINLLFTFTRSSWLGFLAGALVIGLRRYRKVLVPLIGTVVLVVAISSPEMRERMTSIFDPSHPNNVSRVHMWGVGLAMAFDYPLFGIGDIGTEHLWDKYAEPGWVPEGHLHNNLLMWLVTLGLAGFAALIVLFIKIWIHITRIESRTVSDWFSGSLSLGALAVLAGFHVNGLFEWNFGDAEIIMLIWCVVGLSLAVGRLEEGLEKS